MPVASNIVRRDTKAGRFYEVVVEEETYLLRSVTHVLSAIAKPALVFWAANRELTLGIETSADLYVDLFQQLHATTTGGEILSRTAYIATVKRRLGQQKAHQRELETAGNIGSEAHALIEWTLRDMLGQAQGKAPVVRAPARAAFVAFQSWASTVDLQPIFVEQTVYSLNHAYAGTMDLLAKVDGKLTLIDWKTSTRVYNEASLQNIAYQQAVQEMGHPTPERGLIIRLPKTIQDKGFEVVDVPQWEASDLFPVFLAVKKLWDWWHPHQRKSPRKKQST